MRRKKSGKQKELTEQTALAEQTALMEQTALAEQSAVRQAGKPAMRKKKKKAPVIIAVAVVLFLILRIVGCALAKDPGALVTTANASRGEIQESISTSGTVESGEVKVYFSQVNGKISDVMVKEGDVVSAGDELICFDMEDMGRTLQQATLQHEASNAGYQSVLSDNSTNQAKLSEANTNLSVLEQQISDYSARLKELQEELSDSQRENSNNLVSENYQLSSRRADLQAELEELEAKKKEAAGTSGEETGVSGSLSDPAVAEIQERIQQIEAELTQISGELSENEYEQSVAANSDYVAQMNREIASVQEELNKCQEYKAQMESQKSASEMSVLDAYDRKQYAANNDLADLTYEEAKRQYDAADGGVRADFDGVVTSCQVIAGSAVTENMQLLTLESNGNVKVVFQASRSDVEKLALGQKAEVSVAGHVYQGEVSRIDHVASRNESNTPMVGAEVRILDPDENIILGLDAKLTVYTDKVEDALLIPVEAVNSDREGDFLYAVENGVVVKKAIVCGISNDLYTEVKEGITEADQIILTSYTALEEGMAVTVLPQ